MNHYNTRLDYEQYTRPVTSWLERHTTLVFGLFITSFLVLDTTTTLVGLELGFSEANHTTRSILETTGYLGFVGTKLLVTSVLCGGYLWSRHYSVTIIALVYGVVAGIAAVWNTLNIALFVLVIG